MKYVQSNSTPFANTLLSLAIATCAAQAHANSDIEEIVVEGQHLYNDEVTALKTPTPIIDVPQSLSIITSDQIKLQGFDSVTDIIDYTPGVNSSQGEGHRDSVVFRGIRSTADFYIDGMRDDVQYYRPLYNLQQVEVLRGPNALLFGRGGTGGILNRVTKKGEIGEDFIGYNVGVNSEGQYGFEFDGNASPSDNVAFRLNAMYEGLNGHRDFFDGTRIGINPTAKFQFNDDTQLDASYEYVNHERFIDRGIPTGADGRPVAEFADVVFGDQNVNTNELTAHLVRASLQHQFSENLKANVSAFYGDYEKMYQNFYASSYDAVNTPELVTLDGYIDNTDRKNMILSANLVGQTEIAGFSNQIIVGFEYIDTSSDQDRWNTFWDTTQDDNEIFEISNLPSLIGGVGVNAAGIVATNDFTIDMNDYTQVDINVSSLYVQDEIEVSDKLDVVLGARLDRFEIDVFNVAASEQRSKVDEELSPRAGIVYKPVENMSLYASYSESFLPRSGEQFANINGDADQLDPDVFENKEIGFKWDADNGLSLTAAYFQNSQVRAGRDNATGESFEVRGVEIDGFEVQLNGQLTDQLSIRSGYSYLDGETASGETPRELPENMASVWAGYQVSDRIGLGLGATYQGSSLIKDGGSEYLPSYTRFDAMAYYDISDDFRVQLNVENLTDKDYYPNAHSSHQVTVGAPLTAKLSISGRF